MAANPEVKIVVDVAADTDIIQKVETAFLAELEPDIVLQNAWPPLTTSWVDKGVIVPVDNYLKDWGFEGKFKDEALRSWTFKNKLIAFPLEGYTWPFWYNTKIFTELNLPIPTTWDEIIADAPKIKAAGYEVVAAGANDDSGYYTFSNFLQGSMTSEEFAKWLMEGHLASYPNAVKAIEQFVKARDAGVFPDDAAGLQGEAVNNLYYTGKAAIWQGGSWFFAECPEEIRKVSVVGGVPLPTPAAWDKNYVNGGYDGKGVMITRNGFKKLDTVKKLIQFFFTPEHIGWFVQQAGMVPPLKEVKVDETQLNNIFMQTLQWGDKYWVPPVFPGLEGVDISQIAKDLWIHTTTADMIVKGMDQAWLNVLGK
jgi:multiple sugar transport system substrate-binding protein